MIELFSANTPNGRKISIMLEEIKFDYKITEINLSKGDQFNIDFRKISPFSKIPAITDHKNKISLFQTLKLSYSKRISRPSNNVEGRGASKRETCAARRLSKSMELDESLSRVCS